MNLKILHFDDEETNKLNIEKWLVNINLESKSEDIDFKVDVDFYSNNFTTSSSSFYNIINKYKSDADLIILDLYEKNIDTGENEMVGTNILEYLSSLPNENIPKVLVASKNLAYKEFETLKNNYSFVLPEAITKSADYSKIKEIIYMNFMTVENYTLYEYDELDGWLQADVKNIGEDNLADVLLDIKKRWGEQGKKIQGKFYISRISAGFSGASIFKVKIENKLYVLKISKEIDKLKEEYNNGIGYYRLLDHSLKIDFSMGGEVKNVYYLLIELVEGNTLFDYLKNNNDAGMIENKFKKLFFTQKYQDLYNNSDKREGNYTDIFSGFNESWKIRIKKNIKMMLPIANKLKEDNGIYFDENNLLSIFNKEFEDNFRYINSQKEINENKIGLSHGDFHSKNILVAESDVVTIIDTGAMGYYYWCSDISRLIVHMFLSGIDAENYSFYSFDEISRYYSMSKNITLISKVENQQNNGYIHAINWLIENAESIFSDTTYCKWEFQLCLAKEFLQHSSWDISCSPSKKVLALFAAHDALKNAEDEARQIFEKG